MNEKPYHLGHRKRLRERFMAAAEHGLPDYEMLEMVLYQSIKRGDVKPLAKRLIKHFGGFGEVISAEPGRLAEVEGVGEAVVVSLKVVQAAALRLARGRILERPAIASWQALLDYCQASMSYKPTEQFRILFLDRKNKVVADEIQQTGTVDHTPVYPREVVKRALELGASAVIMVHNHPSGDPSPSDDDITMTNQVVEAGKALGIKVHDHLIIGKGRHVSFKAMGLL